MELLTLKNKNKILLVGCVCRSSQSGLTRYIKARIYSGEQVLHAYQIAQECNLKINKDGEIVIKGCGFNALHYIADIYSRKNQININDIVVENF